MKNKARSAILQYNMLVQGAELLVAVSGGADSVALLRFFMELREEWGLHLGALHLNHNLRGAESSRDEAFVRELCRDWGVPLTVESADVAACAREWGESLEAAARRCRYHFFERIAGERQARVATAHTGSDNAETVLLNLIRGTALRGLAGIAPVRGRYIRPLIHCSRAEVEQYCAEQGLTFVTDSTNHSDAYTRNRVRRHILPLLEQENPRLLEGITRMTQLIRTDADYLDGQARAAIQALAGPGGEQMDRTVFLNLPAAIEGRVLAELVRQAGVPVESATVQSLLAILQEGRGARQLSPQVRFLCRENAFWLERVVRPQAYFSVEVTPSQLEQGCRIPVFSGKEIHLRVDSKENLIKSQLFHKKVLNYCLDYDRISKIITLRQRLPSDKLRLPDRGCAKTLKNLFQEKGVDALRRLERVVLDQEGKALWVEGLGPDESGAVTNSTNRVLIIEVTEGTHDRGDLKSFD